MPGIKWGSTKTPIWSTKVQKSASGRELRAAYYSQPIWKFSLSYEVLRANALAELQTLVGFFNARQGSFDSFLYEDPEDNTAVQESFGITSSTTQSYQLLRALGGHLEAVIALKGTPSIYVNGVLKTAGTDYTLSAAGVVTFTAAQTNGKSLTWSGGFYRRVRFLQDSADFERFMHQLWSLKKIEFQTTKD